MIFSIAIIGLIFTAVIISSNYSQPQPQQHITSRPVIISSNYSHPKPGQHITFKQGVEREQEYISDRSYYLSQGCKPQTIDKTHHVLTWNCPPGTVTAQEQLLTGNKTSDEICHEPKYKKTKAYTELCT
jgi:hypothetical protein